MTRREFVYRVFWMYAVGDDAKADARISRRSTGADEDGIGQAGQEKETAKR